MSLAPPLSRRCAGAALASFRSQALRPQQPFRQHILRAGALPRPPLWQQAMRPASFEVDIPHEHLPDIDPSRLVVEQRTTPGELPDLEGILFGHRFTDHMLTINWDTIMGWHAPRITPFQPLALHPAACVLHYAFSAFEGMKAYRDAQGTVRLFRPDRNMARLNRSSARLALPTFDGAALTGLIARLCRLDSRFIPNRPGYSLYLRPAIIGTQNTLGVGPPSSAMLFVIASPVGPYYATGFKAVSLEATDYAVRAWPGGVGNMKLAANYAPCIVPQRQATARGFQQNLWLFGPDEYVTEVGAMNFFAAVRDKATGQNQLLTPPLDGMILEGVTRDSVLALARERLVPEGWAVIERKITMRELADAAHEGRLLEAFGSGTAAVISPVRNIGWRDQLINCGLKEDEEAGAIATKMRGWIEARQTGEDPHEWSYVC